MFPPLLCRNFLFKVEKDLDHLKEKQAEREEKAADQHLQEQVHSGPPQLQVWTHQAALTSGLLPLTSAGRAAGRHGGHDAVQQPPGGRAGPGAQ